MNKHNLHSRGSREDQHIVAHHVLQDTGKHQLPYHSGREHRIRTYNDIYGGQHYQAHVPQVNTTSIYEPPCLASGTTHHWSRKVKQAGYGNTFVPHTQCDDPCRKPNEYSNFAVHKHLHTLKGKSTTPRQFGSCSLPCAPSNACKAPCLPTNSGCLPSRDCKVLCGTGNCQVPGAPYGHAYNSRMAECSRSCGLGSQTFILKKFYKDHNDMHKIPKGATKTC